MPGPETPTTQPRRKLSDIFHPSYYFNNKNSSLQYHRFQKTMVIHDASGDVVMSQLENVASNLSPNPLPSTEESTGPYRNKSTGLKALVGRLLHDYTFNEDKQREVWKGFAELKKAYDNKGEKLTAEEAGVIISSRRYKASRLALNKIALKYVEEKQMSGNTRHTTQEFDIQHSKGPLHGFKSQDMNQEGDPDFHFKTKDRILVTPAEGVKDAFVTLQRVDSHGDGIEQTAPVEFRPGWDERLVTTKTFNEDAPLENIVGKEVSLRFAAKDAVPNEFKISAFGLDENGYVISSDAKNIELFHPHNYKFWLGFAAGNVTGTALGTALASTDSISDIIKMPGNGGGGTPPGDGGGAGVPGL